MTTVVARVSERTLIRAIARYLAASGYVVFTNVNLLDTEIDIVAIKERRNQYIVKIVEVKTMPKKKLIQQIHSRACIANFVYAGLPAMYHEWARRNLPEWCGIILVHRDGKVQIARRAKLVNTSSAPRYFAQLLLTCGNFASAKVYGPGSDEKTQAMRILARLRTFLSSFDSLFTSSSSSSDSSSSPGSSSSTSIPSLVLYSVVLVLDEEHLESEELGHTIAEI